MATNMSQKSFELQYTDAQKSALIAAQTREQIKADNARNTFVMPLHWNLRDTRTGSAMSVYNVVRRETTNNPLVCYYGFAQIVLQHGARLTNKDISEQDFIRFNPLSGYYVRFDGARIIRVSRKDKTTRASEHNARDMAARLITRTMFVESAKGIGAGYLLDNIHNTANQDRHIPLNQPEKMVNGKVHESSKVLIPDFNAMSMDELINEL